jgi:cell division septal protein FtsQ
MVKKKVSLPKKSSTKAKPSRGPAFSMRDFLAVAAFLVCAGLACWGYVALRAYVLTSPKFIITKVTGNAPVDYRVPAKTNIFALDVAQVGRQLRKRHPEYKSVVAVRQFPDTLRIEVIKRDAVLQIEQDGYYLVDKDGIVISLKLPEPADTVVLQPPFKATDNVSLGTKITFDRFDDAVALAVAIRAHNQQAHFRLGELWVSGTSDMRFTVEDIEVRVGKGEYEPKIAKLFEQVLPKFNRDFAKIEYIDLRFDDYVIGYKK